MSKIKPIFKDLSDPTLLKKSLRGRTQNLNELFNNFIWTRIPKNIFAEFDTLKLGLHDAKLSFSGRYIGKCEVLSRIGYNMVPALMKIDVERNIEGNKSEGELARKARILTET